MTAQSQEVVMNSIFRRTQLPNDLRILTETMTHVRSVSIGVWVLTGLQHENSPKLAGISHFIEHMVFRGTLHRSSDQIAEDLESVGGYIEAITGREYTCYHIRILDDYLELAVDLLADLLNNPKFDPDDIQKEKAVVIEEIKAYEHSLSDYAREVLYQTIWKDYYLGRLVSGTIESVENFDADLLREYWFEFYRTGRVVISAAGKVDHDEFVRMCEHKFHFPDAPRSTLSLFELGPLEKQQFFDPKEISHAYICFGTRILSLTSDELYRYSVQLLSTILGNGISSRLFRSLREREGLVYGINCFIDLYRESGIFGINSATDAKNTQKVLNLIHDELFWLVQEGITPEELERAKNQHKSTTVIHMEVVSNRMRQIALQEINHLRFYSLDEILQHIDNVTVELVNDVAKKLLNEKYLTLVLIGPKEIQRLLI